jgi:hypothetical protein
LGLKEDVMENNLFKVRILNETLGIGEKIARIGNIEGTSVFREASLSITPKELALSCTDDAGSVHALGGIAQKDLKRIRLKKSVFTPGQQLMKPAMSGAFTGVVLAVILSFSNRPISIGSGIFFVLGCAALLVVFNLGKIVWSHLAVVVFESGDGKSVEVAIEDEKADALVAPFAERNIPVEPL